MSRNDNDFDFNWPWQSLLAFYLERSFALYKFAICSSSPRGIVVIEDVIFMIECVHMNLVPINGNNVNKLCDSIIDLNFLISRLNIQNES